MTPALVEALCTALKAGNTRTAAAAFVGVHRDTFYDWLSHIPTFSDAVEKAEAEAEVRYLGLVARAAQAGNWQASAWWLERRRPDDYGRRQRVEFHIETQRKAQMIADELGVTVEEVLAEADRILAEGKV